MQIQRHLKNNCPHLDNKNLLNYYKIDFEILFTKVYAIFFIKINTLIIYIYIYKVSLLFF